MSSKPYTEKIKKKKIGICSIVSRIWIWIQNRTRIQIRIKMIRIWNTELKTNIYEEKYPTKYQPCFVQKLPYKNSRTEQQLKLS